MTGGKIVTKEVFVSRVEEMIPVLYRVCRAHFCLPQDREDAVQEALVRAWEKRDTLRDERYMQTGSYGSCSTYATAFTANAAVQKGRRCRRHRLRPPAARMPSGRH